jgi:hypothetical protein
MRHPVTFLAFTIALAAATPAQADLIATGMKIVKPTYELTGIAEHPGYLYVVFPYIGCDIDPDFFKYNPQHDRAEPNYQVLRPGERYEVPKFCDGKIYAFDAKAFTTEERVAEADYGFYRKKGDKLLAIPEFEKLKSSEKIKFVATDPRVKASGFSTAFPLAVPDRFKFKTTTDVLRVASVDDKHLVIEGVKVVLHFADGPDREVPYTGGRRPEGAGGDPKDDPNQPAASADTPKPPASADASKPPAPEPPVVPDATSAPADSGNAYLLGGIVLTAAAFAGASALLRKKRG